MNCRHILKCYLGIAVALLFAPQPKVMASTFNGCQADLNQIVSDSTVALEPADIFGNDIEQIGTQEQPLPTTSPYKASSSKNVVWRMRMLRTDYESYQNQGSQDVTYTIINQFPLIPSSRLRVEAVSGSVQKYADCQVGSQQSVLLQGTARLIFSELDRWTVGNYTPRFNVCFPGIRTC
jgi:hypothetical protein